MIEIHGRIDLDIKLHFLIQAVCIIYPCEIHKSQQKDKKDFE